VCGQSGRGAGWRDCKDKGEYFSVGALLHGVGTTDVLNLRMRRRGGQALS
jgi:hypothetical protein